MNRTFITLLFAFCIGTSFSQPASFEASRSTSSVLLQKVVPPSPTAASLGKYGDQQINMFTGTSMVNIPIYEIKTNNFSIPLSLTYSTSGLKVTEAASWVGLGWSLNGTGVITRLVKGAPDGVQNPISIRTWPVPLTYTQVNDNAWNYLHPAIQLGIVDREPDIYIVRAGKLSVKFYYDLYGRIQTIPYNNDIKIKFDGVNNKYTITDVDGSIYVFGGDQSTELTYSTNPTYASYTTSWFLNNITTSTGALITFHNELGPNLQEQDQYSESEEVKSQGQSGDCSSTSGAGRTTQFSSQTFLPVFLKSIETDKEIVYLNRDVNERADLPGDYALTDIKVYSKLSGKYEYNFSLSYSYFPQVSTVCWGGINHPHNSTAICKRLRLDQFTEKGSYLNTSNFKTYQFQYSTASVPSRCSLDQDYWGYYNGAGNTSMLPSVTDPEFQTSTYNAASREANSTYAAAGMLQKIIYPTGGESDFTYEPNVMSTIGTATFTTATTALAGTSSLYESSVPFTISNAQAATINFTLSDPNLLDQGLQRKVQIINQSGTVVYSALNYNSPGNGILLTGYSYLAVGTYTLKVSRNYLYSSYPSIPAVGITATVTYAASSSPTLTNRTIGGFRIQKIVDKTDPTGSDLNIKQYMYENPYFIADIKNTDCISIYNRWNTVYANGNPLRTYNCNFKSRTSSSVQPVGSAQGSSICYGKVTCIYGATGGNGKTEYFYSTDPDAGGYSLNPIYQPITSYDHRRGNLLTQIDYDASGNVKKIKANNYDVTLRFAGAYTFPYYIRDEPINNIVVTASLLPFKVISFSDFALPSEWVRIKNTTETVFDGSNYVSMVKEFSYDNTNYSFVTQTKTTNSKGNVITAINKYPLDYKPSGTKSNEEIERQFDSDYQALFNSFVSCDNAAGNTTAINACYTSYQSSFDNLINNRNAALTNYQSTFTTLANGTSDPVLKGEYQMIAANKVADLIETTEQKDVTTELSKTTNNFKMFSTNVLLEKVNKSVLANTPDNEITINSYDAVGNLLQATPHDGIIISYLWDYQNKFPIAQVRGAVQSNIAYTSFEADGTGNWTFSGTPYPDPTAPTGKKAYLFNGSNAITKSSLNPATTYVVSYWRPTAASALTITGSQSGYPITGITVNGWKYFEHRVTGVSSVSLSSSSGSIDELRLYPLGAQVTTYTYSPLIGITTQCDVNSKITFYEYDLLNRLMLIRDQDRNIVKQYCYNYSGQTENCTLVGNQVQSNVFFKNDCSGCQAGTSVTYTVPAGTYSAPSQVLANQLASDDVNANGQAYANAMASCTAPANSPLTGTNAISNRSFSVQLHNNCTGTNYNYTLNASTTNVSLSPQPPQGNYNITFTRIGGTGTYTFIANGFSINTATDPAVINNVDISPSGNQIRVQP